MSRGHPPVVPIAEAMRYAERIGFSVIGVHACWLASDYMASREGKIQACPGQATPVTPATDCRISWHPAPRRSWNSGARRSQKTSVASSSVRVPDRYWHWYAIFTDRIETVKMYPMSASRHLGQQTLLVG